MEKDIQASDFEPYQVVDLNKEYGDYQHYKITGNLPEGVFLTVKGNVTVKAPGESAEPAVWNGARIEATGKIRIEGRTGDGVMLQGSEIVGTMTGSSNSIHATDGTLFIPYLGDKNTLTGSRDIECLKAGDHLTATAGDEMKFASSVGGYAVLRGASVTGGSCGIECTITATKNCVDMHYAGNGTKISSAEPAHVNGRGAGVLVGDYFERSDFSSQPFSSKPTSTLTAKGCGIYFDTATQSYVFDKANGQKYGQEAMDTLMQGFVDFESRITTGSAVTADDKRIACHFASLPESHADQQSARKLINNFVAQHKQRGED